MSSTAPTTGTPPEAWTRAQQQTPMLQEALLASMDPEGTLATAGRYHLGNPGKLVRGGLALAASEALGVSAERSLPLAMACELLHNASLVHDDLQDRDVERRGEPTVWRRFGEATAVTLGDFLLTAAVHAAGRIDGTCAQRLALTQAFTGSTLAIIRGQAADTSEPLPSIGRYEAIARAKTGPLLALPIEGALILAGAGDAERADARETMELVGTAFQIQDDLQDMCGGKGRRIGSDLRAGRPNAVVAYFMEEASGSDRDRLCAAPALGDEEIYELASRIRCSSAVDRCLDRQHTLGIHALWRASRLPIGLAQVLAYAIERFVGIDAKPVHTDSAGPIPMIPRSSHRNEPAAAVA